MLHLQCLLILQVNLVHFCTNSQCGRNELQKWYKESKTFFECILLYIYIITYSSFNCTCSFVTLYITHTYIYIYYFLGVKVPKYVLSNFIACRCFIFSFTILNNKDRNDTLRRVIIANKVCEFLSQRPPECLRNICHGSACLHVLLELFFISKYIWCILTVYKFLFLNIFILLIFIIYVN